MILRGAVLSDSRLSLETESRKPAERPAPASTRELEPVVVERIVPAPITFEAVAKWLEEGDARQQITEYLAEDLDRVRADAHTAGLASGKSEGLAHARALTQSAIDTLQTLVGRAEVAFETEAQELATQCAEIVCAAIAKIAGPVLSMREAALGTILEVIKQVKDERELTLRVSAHDLPALLECREDIERACAGRRFTLVADSKVDAGGCIVESVLGSIDGRFDVQLRGLCETLRAAKSMLAEES
jgi:flagellar biosynthesis/type III secretory pathway protein FliH